MIASCAPTLRLVVRRFFPRAMDVNEQQRLHGPEAVDSRGLPMVDSGVELSDLSSITYAHYQVCLLWKSRAVC